MNDDHLDDDQVDDFLSGRATPPGHDDVTAVFADLRRLSEPHVRADTSLAEFIAGAPAPTRPPTFDETELQLIAPATSAAPAGPGRRPRRLIQLALAAGIGLAGMGGAHAAGVLDVPLLPDTDEPAEIVLADTAPALGALDVADEPAAGGDGEDQNEASSGGVSLGSNDPGEFSARIGFGDLSVSIMITGDDLGGYAVTIDVEGVSPECEAAIEAIDTIPTDGSTDPRLDAAAAACEGEFEAPGPLAANPEELDRLFEELELELDLPDDLGAFEGLFGDDFGTTPFDSDEFPQHFDGDLDQHLEKLEEFFDGFEAGTFLEDFDPRTFLEDFDPNDLQLPEELDSFLEDFDPNDLQLPEELQELLGGFFGDLEGAGGG